MNDRAEAICKKYLSEGFKAGNHWMVGSITNDPGKSFVVTLTGPKRGKCFENSDGSSYDMLDVVDAHENLNNLRKVAEYAAEHLLNLPVPTDSSTKNNMAKKIGSFVGEKTQIEKSQKLFDLGVDISGTVAERYLDNRGIKEIDTTDLRFLKNCFYSDGKGKPITKHPALLQAIRGAAGEIISVNKTYLKPDGSGKADVFQAKKVTGNYEGYGVALGTLVDDILIVGEGFETVASFQLALSGIPAIAGLSMYHTSVLRIPKQIKKLILAKDFGKAGDVLEVKLRERCDKIGIDFASVDPLLDDLMTIYVIGAL